VLIIILIVVVVLVLLFGLIVQMQPGTFRLEKSMQTFAPAATVFANVNDFHRWDLWSPWIGIDKNLEQTYEGAPSGVGAGYSWVGKKTGAGRMTIIESRPNELIKIRLEFLKPFKATNTAEFTFMPVGNHTVVTWAMYGEKTFVTKFIQMMASMDSMVGPMFERGLAKLKKVSAGSAG
jgi:hypothetical protein